jgi:hypothetical protein
MNVQKIGWTIVQRAATDPELVIVTTLASTESGMFDAIDVVRSGLSDCTSHPYPENHTHREP